MINEFISEINACGSNDERFNAIYKLASRCASSTEDRKRFDDELYMIHRKRRVREYKNDGWYDRLIYNYLVRPVKFLGKRVHPDWPNEFFEGRVFYYYYKTTFRGFVDDIIDNIDKYKAVYDLLADERSKEVMNGVLKGRLIGSKEEFVRVMDPVDSQYFDETVIGHMDKEAFADIGGFDGQSTVFFFDYAKKSDAVSYIFELDHTNASNMRQRFEGNDRVHVIEKGCGDKEATVYYDGSASVASITDHETGKQAIITTLDKEIEDKLTFIKMDVEGAEESVLRGAGGHIANDKPRLAVCIYHKPDDLWKLQGIIAGFRNDYKYYIRQYGAGEAETVLYAV